MENSAAAAAQIMKKRKASGPEHQVLPGSKPASPEEIAEGLRNLGLLESHTVEAVLRTLVNAGNRDAITLINATRREHLNKPVNVNAFGSRTYRALHQLDGLRSSKIFERAYEITSELDEIISESKRLSPVNAVRVLVRIAGVLSHVPENDDTVWREITRDYSNPVVDVADALEKSLTLLSRDEFSDLEEPFEKLCIYAERFAKYDMGECFDKAFDIIDRNVS